MLLLLKIDKHRCHIQKKWTGIPTTTMVHLTLEKTRFHLKQFWIMMKNKKLLLLLRQIFMHLSKIYILILVYKLVELCLLHPSMDFSWVILYHLKKTKLIKQLMNNQLVMHQLVIFIQLEICMRLLCIYTQKIMKIKNDYKHFNQFYFIN